MSRSVARLTLSLAVAAAIVGATAVTPAIADPTAPAAGGEIVQVALTLTGSSAPALAFARKTGLHVDLVTRHTVLLSGPATQAGDAFGARMRRVSARGNPAGATRYLAPAAAPSVPDALRGAVSAVIGLDNRPVFERHIVPAGYTASDLGTAYGTNEMAGAGAGITVGTVQFDGWFPSDATTYAAAAGITIGTNQITTVQLPHSNVTPDGSGGDQEVALDVEALLATAPKAAQRVYIAPNNSAGAIAVYSQIADDVAAGRVQVVATSWGGCEPGFSTTFMSQLATSINRMVASGGTVFAASGDNGAYDCARPLVPNGQLTVDFPASLPSVVAVGGTTLTQGGSGAFTETGWGPAPTTTSGTTYAGKGSGGGVSAVFARPAYQSSISAGGTGRAVPDVSALAGAKTGFGAYSSSAGGWHLFGGTSFGAPMWAGQLASALSAGGLSSGLGDIHAALYGAPSAFRDVTSGANGFYSAGSGYDLVTGLGSPQWTALYTALGLRLPVFTSVEAGGTVSSPTGEPVVATVTSPLAGTVSFLPLTSPRAPARTAALPQGLRITGPGAPLTLAFALQLSLLPAGALPSEVRVFHDGTVVPACTTGAAQCLASSSQAADGLHYTVNGASSGDWIFAVDRVVRLAGADRVGTAVAVSRAAFAAGSAPAAVLARADQYADALAGAPLAAAKKGPLLLTGSSALASADATELTRAVLPGGTVYLLGGPGALSPVVADQVTALGFTVVRLAGTDRFATATAIAVATALDPTGPILLTTGLSFPDALAAGAAAAHTGAAVLLTAGGTRAPATQAFLAAHPNATLYAVGGPAARAYPQAIALVGSDRYATAVLVARRFFPGVRAAGLASGVSFPDALSAGPILGSGGVPLLLTGTTSLASVTGGYLTTAKALTVHMFGGKAALGAGVTTAVWSTLG